MNYLAHLYLSQSDINLMVGNYIADHVKGKDYLKYSEGVQQGIMMHREIDTFTDSHSIPQKGKDRLYEKYGKYSAVLIDMFYDHVLAKEWSDYSPIPLSTFSRSAYKLLKSQQHLFPAASSRTLDWMSRGDWLSGYATVEGIGRALNGISQRARFENNMDESVDALIEFYPEYKAEFAEFLPLLIKHLRPYYEGVD
jgi:acyl carrier protein phosphodiesterase